MYRIVLLAENPKVELKIDRLLRDRMRGRYLMKVLPSAGESVPLINGKAPSVVITTLAPGSSAVVEERMHAIVEYAGGIPVVALLEEPNERVEVAALHGGAQDCLVLSELTARGIGRVIRNAVERARVEERLAREQEMLGNLLARLPDRIYFKDLESRFLRVNNAMARFFRLRSPEGAVGRSDHDFFTLEHARPAREDERQIMETGQSIIDKLEKETLPDGSVSWVLTSKLPMRNKFGEITGTFGISHDVTAMKLLEETIEAERLRLEELTAELRRKNMQLEDDLVLAREIQQAMLPARHSVYPAGATSREPRVEWASVYRPAEAVGGDFFTIVPVSPNKAGVLISDIMGHGMRAALGTAIMRGLVEELREQADRPDVFLTEINLGLRAILRNVDEPLLITACYLVIDVESDEVLISSAGHPLPMIIASEGGGVRSLEIELPVHGPALALFDDANYGMETFRLRMNDRLLLFTDGATEMIDGDGHVIGLDRFVAALERRGGLDAREMGDRVLDDIQAEAGGAAFEDDVCLLAITRRGALNDGGLDE